MANLESILECLKDDRDIVDKYNELRSEMFSPFAV